MFGNNSPSKSEQKVTVRGIESLEEELRTTSSKSFATDLSPHDLYLLHQNGYEPLGYVVGVIVYSMGLRGLLRSVTRAFQRGEMGDFSRLNEIARDIAIERMQKKAEAFGATGVVGVHLNSREYADFIEVVATGTAVKRVSAPKSIEVVLGA